MAAENPNNLEPEDDTTSLDGDSAFLASTSDMTDVTSINSAIKQYRRENGRTYHNYGVKEYFGPNDEEAQEHHDISHQFWTVLQHGELIHAPIGKVQRVLDLGTGTGIWAIDFADAHPDSDVKGVDLSPIQPTFVPPNCHFEVDDFNTEFLDDGKFDLIHQRELNGSIADPPAFYRGCFDALAPGGWLDISEFEVVDLYSASHDDKAFSQVAPKDHPLNGAVMNFFEACERAGIDGNIAPKIEGWLKDTGFISIKVEKVKIPIGRWPKDKHQRHVGAWDLLRLQTGIRGFFLRLGTSQLGMTAAEVEASASKMIASLSKSQWQLFENIYLISAQKPFEPSNSP